MVVVTRVRLPLLQAITRDQSQNWRPGFVSYCFGSSCCCARNVEMRVGDRSLFIIDSVFIKPASLHQECHWELMTSGGSTRRCTVALNDIMVISMLRTIHKDHFRTSMPHIYWSQQAISPLVLRIENLLCEALISRKVLHKDPLLHVGVQRHFFVLQGHYPSQ